MEEIDIEDKYQTLNKGTIYRQNLIESESYNFGTLDIAEDLKEFKSFNCVITSKTNSGKSVLLNDLCYQIKDWYQHVFVFSLTAYLQKDMFNYIKKENIHLGFNEEKLNEIWNSQEELKKKLNMTKIDPDKIPRVLILYDDLISDPKVRNSPILKRMFVAGRHANISQIFLTQSFTAIPPVLRKNVAIAIAFYLDNYMDREAFAKSYLSTKNVKLGIMVFDRVTKEPYTAICILNCKVTQNPEDYIKMYKAKLKVPKFKMGNTEKNIKHSINFGLGSTAPSTGYANVDFLPRINRNIII